MMLLKSANKVLAKFAPGLFSDTRDRRETMQFPSYALSIGEERRDRATRLNAYCDRLLEKRDYEMAAKLFVQIDILKSGSRRAFRAQKAATKTLFKYRSYQANAPEPDAGTFDFLFVTSGRSASTAIQTLLSLHPDVFVLPRHELDHALEDSGERSLLARYQRQIMAARPNIKVGLMQHAYVSGLYGGPEYAERMSRIVKPDFFVQSVREPARLLRSLFNNQIVASFGGAHKFEAIVPDSVFTLTSGIPLIGATDSRVSFSDPDTPVRPVSREKKDELLAGMAQNVKLFAFGDIYRRYFDQWLTLDFALESRKRGGGGALRALELIGVGDAFFDPMFENPINSELQQIMVQNLVDVRVEGGSLFVGLSFADMVVPSYSFPLTELIQFSPPPEWIDAGLEDRPLALTTRVSKWLALPRKTRSSLLDGDDLLKFARNFLVPAWIENYEIWRQAFDPLLVSHEDPEFCRKVYQDNAADISAFVAVHPEYVDLWPQVNEYL